MIGYNSSIHGQIFEQPFYIWDKIKTPLISTLYYEKSKAENR